VRLIWTARAAGAAKPADRPIPEHESVGRRAFRLRQGGVEPEAEEALKKVAVVLQQFPESMLTIEGYTDSKGGKSVNMQLSQARAASVRDWLVRNGQLPPTNITAKGFGEQNPVAPNTNADGSDNPAGRALNRRVSIVVEKPPAATPVATVTPSATP
jgi:outer membrane protein OmpA-like peptidoglycan-associated protein